MGPKNILSSTLVGFSLGSVVTGAFSFIRNQKAKKLISEKNKHTSSLNRKIGYEQCKLDELKEHKKKINGKKIIRKSALKTQLQEVEKKIKNQEIVIKEYEKKIEQIRLCKNITMLREVLNNFKKLLLLQNSSRN